jgi:hypothetical protein
MDQIPTTEISIEGAMEDLPQKAAAAVRTLLDHFDQKQLHGKVTWGSRDRTFADVGAVPAG